MDTSQADLSHKISFDLEDYFLINLHAHGNIEAQQRLSIDRVHGQLSHFHSFAVAVSFNLLKKHNSREIS